MRLVVFDMQKPVDPQVNGFGIYRTVVDGTEPLLVGRFEIPLYPHASHTHPWESADCGQDDTELTLNFTKGSQNTFNNGETVCTMTQIWEALGTQNFHWNSEDDNGYVCTYLWEMRGEWGAPEDEIVAQSKYTWALTTVLSDASLGEAVETDHDLPPKASLVAEFQESLFLAGLDINPHYLVWSKRFHPESFPAANFLEVGDANDPIHAIVPIAGVLGVFTRDTKYRVNGNATSGFVHFEAISHRGTRAYKSAVPSEHGIIFVANDGVFTTNLIGADQKISQAIEPIFNPDNWDQDTLTGDLPLEEPINQAYAHLISACYFKSKYRFVYPAGTSQTTINREAVYDFDTQKWVMNSLSVASYYVEEDLDYLTGGGQDGKLHRLENSTADGSSAITIEWISKDFEGVDYSTRSLFAYFRVDAYVPEGEILNAQFYVDNVLVRAVEITGARTNVLNPLPENTQGLKWRVHLGATSGAGGIVIYGLSAYHIPLVGLNSGT